jgi:replicative DNA helicase
MSGTEPRPRAARGRLRPVPEPDRQPPHNLEAEEAVLGAVLTAGQLLTEVIALVEETDFYRPAHRTIWRAMLRLADRDEPTDPVTVLGELNHTGELADVGGAPFLHTLVEAVPTVSNAGHYAQLVADTARRRRVIDLGIRLAHSDADPAVLVHLAGELADTTTAACGDHDWTPPIPFGVAAGVPPFPVEVLPAWLGEYVAAVATATQTPPDLAGMLALAVLATVAAGAVEVQPRPGWQEPLCLFVAVGMDAGPARAASSAPSPARSPTSSTSRPPLPSPRSPRRPPCAGSPTRAPPRPRPPPAKPQPTNKKSGRPRPSPGPPRPPT